MSTNTKGRESAAVGPWKTLKPRRRKEPGVSTHWHH